MKFPVFSQLAGNWPSETSSLVTASSSGESCELSVPKVRGISPRPDRVAPRRRFTPASLKDARTLGYNREEGMT